MSSRPYVAVAASLVGESDILHAGARRLDAAEYEALIQGLPLLGPEQCRALFDDPLQAHLFEAAVDKLRHVLGSPSPAPDGAA